MRQPYETLVIPYKKENEKIKYAIFLRSDVEQWQPVCGGGEEGETLLETAKRETFEEAGIKKESKFMRLETITTIPVVSIRGCYYWRRRFLSKRILLCSRRRRPRNKIK